MYKASTPPNSNIVVIKPEFIEDFIGRSRDGNGLVADILRVLEYIEKRANSDGLTATYYSRQMMWYSATMDLRGTDPIAKLSLGLQRGDRVEELIKPYRQTEDGVWRSIEEATYPLPREFWPLLSIEYATFEAFKKTRKSLREQTNGVYSPPSNERHLIRR